VKDVPSGSEKGVVPSLPREKRNAVFRDVLGHRSRRNGGTIAAGLRPSKKRRRGKDRIGAVASSRGREN